MKRRSKRSVREGKKNLNPRTLSSQDPLPGAASSKLPLPVPLILETDGEELRGCSSEELVERFLRLHSDLSCDLQAYVNSRKVLLRRALCLGKILLELKGRLSHGKWLPWLK